MPQSQAARALRRGARIAGPAPGTPVRTRLVLIRHGEAVCNVERRAGGPQGCRGLTDAGRRQAESLRDRLARTGEVVADAVYTSTLPRARETAEILLPALGGAGAVMADAELCELNPGAADAMTWEEIDAAFGYLDIEAEPDRPLAPGGESWRAFRQRAERALIRIADAHRGHTAVVVAHGGIIDGAIGVWFGVSPLALRSINASISEVVREEWEPDGRRWLLARHNDAAHLLLDGVPFHSGYPDG